MRSNRLWGNSIRGAPWLEVQCLGETIKLNGVPRNFKIKRGV